MTNKSGNRLSRASTGNILSVALSALFAALGLSGCANVVSRSQPVTTLSVVPSIVTFPNVVIGTSNSQTIILSNSGPAGATVSHATISASAFSVSGISFPVTIPPGQSISFNVIFTPVSTAAATGTLSFDSSASNSPSAISLHGTAVAETRQLQFDPASIDFGNVLLGAAESSDFVLINTGNSTVDISGITVSGSGYSVTGLSGLITLGPGQSAKLTATFAPTGAGTAATPMTVNSTATNSPSGFLSGTGIVPSVGLSWDPSASAVSYNVYRGPLVDGPYTKLTTVPVANFEDLTVHTGQTYTYVVTFVDASNIESLYSNSATATVDDIKP